jgi:hypothetical protein
MAYHGTIYGARKDMWSCSTMNDIVHHHRTAAEGLATRLIRAIET